MATHSIEPTVETLHYDFSREREPILEIDSGDTVVFSTLDAGAYSEPRTAKDFWQTPRIEGAGSGHALCGPISIRNAKKGQTLAIDFIEITPASWGWTGGGGFDTPLNQRLRVTDEPWTFLEWSLDGKHGTNQFGQTVELRPFMGVVGMPPDEPGSHPTAPPRDCGGNLDCKELVAGTTLYLPMAVDGALFSIGDGHARQGDGEVSGMAIECPMERVEVKLTVQDGPKITRPRAETREGWLTFGLDEKIDEAIAIAIDEMLGLLQERGYERKRAIALASVICDVRVTQLVNGVVGAHCVLPRQ